MSLEKINILSIALLLWSILCVLAGYRCGILDERESRKPQRGGRG